MTNDAEAEVEEFFDIESDLRDLTEAGLATPDVTDVESGVVMAVERVPTTAVPDEYPIPTTGERALAIEVELAAGREATVFVDWPDDGNDVEQIERLLDAASVSFDSFADLYGESIPLEVREGYLVVPLDAPTASLETGDDEESVSPEGKSLTVLVALWTWAAADLVVGNGLTWVGWTAWLAVAVLTFGGTESDHKWVAATTKWTPSGWWPLAVAVAPLVALPVYFLKRFAARANS